jgi:hypothetical protein
MSWIHEKLLPSQIWRKILSFVRSRTKWGIDKDSLLNTRVVTAIQPLLAWVVVALIVAPVIIMHPKTKAMKIMIPVTNIIDCINIEQRQRIQ